jgi:hypothetical protein
MKGIIVFLLIFSILPGLVPNTFPQQISDTSDTRLAASGTKPTDGDDRGPDPLLAERMKHLGLVIPEDVKRRFEKLNEEPPPPLLNSGEYFDWRQLGGVTPVKNQGNCGSCWDFAATGAFESAVLIGDAVQWDLSEQQVLSCNWGGSSCGGGWMDWAYSLYSDYGGIEESCMPYEADDEVPCYQPECPVVVMLDSVIDIQNSVTAIKNALQTGPVSTTFKVYDDFHYDCYWHEPEEEVNHAVVIVGWDDRDCRTGGWIVKNSWGGMWGDQGYFYIPYRSCNIGSHAQLPLYNGPLPLTFVYPEGRPDFLDCAGGSCIRVEVGGQGGVPAPGTGMLFYDIGAGWQSIPMEEISPNVYDAVFPGFECGSNVSYFFTAQTSDGRVITDPPRAPSASYSAYSFSHWSQLFSDDFESDKGWSVVHECSDGQWERAVPHGGEYRGDPAADFDGSGACFLTDNGIADSDVDSGGTYLISPAFDLSGSDAVVFFGKWFTNNYGGAPYNDWLKVWVSGDNGGSWTHVMTFGPIVLHGWKRHSFLLSDFLAPTGQVRIKFDAADLYEDSVVEAGIDAVEIVSVDCAQAPDVSVEIIPESSPVVVPAGGMFRFTGILANNQDVPTSTDAWIMVDVPGYGKIGPIMQVNDVPFAASQQRTIPGIRQHIPRAAPPGDYGYIAYCGEFPSSPCDSSSFVVTVTPVQEE